MFSRRGGKKKNTTVCTVCYDNIYILYLRLPCGHKFHRKCIAPWANEHNSCPLCRESIDKSKPINKCRIDTIDEDHETALRLQEEEYNINEIMHDIVDDVVNWTCADCDNNPCTCERNIQ